MPTVDTPSPRSIGAGEQLALSDPALPGADDDDEPLAETTFVVVDLETTGGDPTGDRITEIGAVKVCGGEVLGEFGTLVDPERSIPPRVVALTGITEMMVVQAPPVGEVLASFIEFARGATLVAHNARFDSAFLRANASRLGLDWPFGPPLCTVTLARRVLPRDEAPSVKLSALAELFDVATRPTHRALDDARATVEVMHRLFERVGNRGVRTRRDLTALQSPGRLRLHGKRSLAAGLPASPGVYLFRGPGDEVLYIGTAVNLRRRVQSYFTGNDSRARMTEMVSLAARVDHVVCAHGLEAGVRELRLLATHRPFYNRRSVNPGRGWWVTLTGERFPRLKVSRTPTEDCFGPMTNRAAAAEAADVVAAAAGLRTCRALGRREHHWCERHGDSPAEPGSCYAAADRPQTVADYLPRVVAARSLILGETDELLQTLSRRLEHLAVGRHFESAARARDRLAVTAEALGRSQRLGALCRIEELVAARPTGDGGWQLSVIRHGRLAAAGVADRGTPPMPVVELLRASAQTVVPGPGPMFGAPADEAGLIERWLGEPGVRLVAATEPYALPAGSAARWDEFTKAARRARDSA